MVRDALQREESCGGHFREEYQTADGEAQRNDQEFSFVSAWQCMGRDEPATMLREDLLFNEVWPSQRSYK